MRMPFLRLSQSMICSLHFLGGTQRASSFRLGTYQRGYSSCQSEDDRQDGLFQGFRRTPIDECPRNNRKCPRLDPRCPRRPTWYPKPVGIAHEEPPLGDCSSSE